MREIAFIRKLLLDLPAPSNLRIWWNFGSLLGVCLATQLVTGLLLACHYTGHIDLAFDSVVHIIRDVPYGWLLRVTHANGASLFFFCLYLHIGRGLYYGSYLFSRTWMIGTTLLLLTIGTAFLGYVLPWGQISFWGASVITSLLSTVPYFGPSLVEWVWGGPSIGNATLSRFYALHFILPFIIAAASAAHIAALHETGSGNPLGVNSDRDKVPFHSYYTFKDIVGFIFVLWLFLSVILAAPFLQFDAVNFVPADPIVTPVHIQPEWYFLFAYAILRSVPNKLGGVIALASSVAILYLLPAFPKPKFRSFAFYPLNQVLYWSFIGCFAILTWIGACPVEDPYVGIGAVFSVLYFLYFVTFPAILKVWDYLIYSCSFGLVVLKTMKGHVPKEYIRIQIHF